MPIITIIFGGLCIALGVISYVVTGAEHVTALIPAFFGLVIEALGVAALLGKARKHVMHAAAALALVGALAMSTSVPKAIALIGGAEVERPEATVARAVFCLLCAAFVVACVRSFIAARRNRSAA